MTEAVARYHCPYCNWHVATRREGSLRATGHVLRLHWQDGQLLWAVVRCTNRACREVCEVRLCDHPLDTMRTKQYAVNVVPGSHLK